MASKLAVSQQNNPSLNRPIKKRRPQQNNQPARANQVTITKAAFDKLLNEIATNKIYNDKFHNKRIPGLKSSVEDYQQNINADYVYGLYHPDVVYRENLVIKSPNIVPIPSSTFAFKETFYTKPNEAGNIVFCWNPNYLGSSDEIVRYSQPQGVGSYTGHFSNLLYCNDESLSGNADTAQWEAVRFRHVTQDFSKYRLTSACIKIKYTGKVLNQSGQFSACASFMEFPRTVMLYANQVNPPATYNLPLAITPQLRRLGDFDNIRQGQWARTVNVVAEPDGITCVWLPVDTLSSVFVDNADSVDPKIDQDFYDEGNFGKIWVTRNANMSFAICGYGISNGGEATNNICVECYYNYEILVREEQMPYFRPTLVDSRLAANAKDLASVVNTISQTAGTITETKKHDAPSVASRIRTAIGRGYNMLTNLAPLVKIASLII